MSILRKILLMSALILISACYPSVGEGAIPLEPTQTPTIISAKPTETTTIEVTQQPLSSPSPEIPSTQICTLFNGESNHNLIDRLTNPFYPPDPGSDDPHQGVDFSDLEPGTRIAISGLAVQNILAGKVAMVTNNRFPYGNAILVETSISEVPESWRSLIFAEGKSGRVLESQKLTCPSGWNDPPESVDFESIYILYAHLLEVPDFEPGENITCGEIVGKIGMSGNALAPHVHIEMRLGPSDTRFMSMAHYDVSASVEEMSNYCRWRISGIYKLIDPTIYLFDPD